MRIPIACAALALAGCSQSSVLPADAEARFDPIAFFGGHTHGNAILHKILGEPVRVRVDSIGRGDGHGGLILDQKIHEGGKPTRHRRWQFRSDGRDGYRGSLTDAAGPVEFVVAGPRASIRYRMKNGVEVEQRLALQRDHNLVINQLIVTKLGLHLARLDETIRKLD